MGVYIYIGTTNFIFCDGFVKRRLNQQKSNIRNYVLLGLLNINFFNGLFCFTCLKKWRGWRGSLSICKSSKN